jgi:hypothetical protein
MLVFVEGHEARLLHVQELNELEQSFFARYVDKPHRPH